MDRDDYAETIACLLRVAWAAAAGQLQLNNYRNRNDDDSENTNSLKSGICSSRNEISPMVCSIIYKQMNDYVCIKSSNFSPSKELPSNKPHLRATYS